MKPNFKFFSILILLIVISTEINFAQEKGQISFMGGYQMLGGFDLVNGQADINDAAAYSGTFAYFLRPDVAVELQYNYQPTQLSFDPFGAEPERVLFDLDVHYILAGASYHRKFSSTVTGFGGLSLGAAIFSPSKDYESTTKFAYSATLGLKVLLSKNVGLRLQAQGLFPIQWTSSGFYIGTGGVDFGIGAGTTVAQITTSAGIFFAF